MQHQASYGAAVDWVIRYSYDHENRWVYKRLDADGDGHADERRIFAYDVGAPLPLGEGSGLRASGQG